jgi:hypothetical protein
MKRKKAAGGQELVFSGGPFDGMSYFLPESWQYIKLLRLANFGAKQNMAAREAARKTRRAQRRGEIDPDDHKAVFRDYIRQHRRELDKMALSKAASEYRHEPESGRLVFVRYLTEEEYLALRDEES